MTKDKKGITLISLIITLIVMLIILGITITSGTVLLDQSRITKVETELYLIKARAETLVEQYSFDGNLKNLLSFSELEKNNSKPTAYNYGREDNLSYKTGDGKEFFTLVTDEFKKDILKIYGLDIASAPHIEVPEGSEDEVFGKYLFVKWGVKECVSQGIMKSSDATDSRVLKNSVINDTGDKGKYAIVVYDIQDGKVESIAYSIGVRNTNGEIEYTLDDIVAIDVEEEE